MPCVARPEREERRAPLVRAGGPQVRRLEQIERHVLPREVPTCRERGLEQRRGTRRVGQQRAVEFYANVPLAEDDVDPFGGVAGMCPNLERLLEPAHRAIPREGPQPIRDGDRVRQVGEQPCRPRDHRSLDLGVIPAVAARAQQVEAHVVGGEAIGRQHPRPVPRQQRRVAAVREPGLSRQNPDPAWCGLDPAAPGSACRTAVVAPWRNLPRCSVGGQPRRTT